MGFELTHPRVAILLSTYNGAAYLSAQLESLEAQTFQNWHLFVRDDGSSDNTLSIVRDFENKHKQRVTFFSERSNLGPSASFLKLLFSVPDSFDFYAFCDQDDIWYEHKLENAIEALSTMGDKPLLYCSCVDCVDEVNVFLKTTRMPRKVGMGNALIENVVIGCTIVLNGLARELIVKKMPDSCVMHDAWCYLVVSCFGSIIFDSCSSIRYRQHLTNTIGAGGGFLKTTFRRVTSLRPKYMQQAQTFIDIYKDDLNGSSQMLVSAFVLARKNVFLRLRLIFSNQYWRQGRVDNILFKALFLLNRF